MKLLKIFAILILFSSTLFAFSNENWVVLTDFASGTGKLYVYNITSGQVIKTFETSTGFPVWAYFSNESNRILTILTTDNKIRNYDDDFQQISVIDLGFDAKAVIRVNETFYYVLEGTPTTSGSGINQIRAVSGSGGILETHTWGTGDAGSKNATMMFQYFKNGSNTYITLGKRGNTGQPQPTIHLLNLTDDTLFNISFTSGGAGVFTHSSFLWYNLTTQRMVWSQISSGGGGHDDSWFAQTVFNSTTLFQQQNISTVNLPDEDRFIGYSPKTNAFVIFKSDGSLREYSDAGFRERDIGNDFFFYRMLPVPEGYNITSGVVAQVGVWFDTYEFSDFCGINQPVGNITCQITDGIDVHSCQTVLAGNQSILVSLTQIRPTTIFRPRTVTEFFFIGSNFSRNETIFTNWSVGIGQRNGWFGVWNLTGGENGNFQNETLRAGWVAYNSPINVLDIEDIIIEYNSTSSGIGCNDGFFRTEWYVGYNLTHYLNRTSFCPAENFTIHDSFIDNDTLGVQVPIHFNTSNNRIITKIFVTTLTSDVDFPSGNAIFVPPDMNITYFNIGRATCTVGNIPSGNYEWTCNLNDSFQSLTGEPFVSDNVVIVVGQNKTIQVPFERKKALTLNISLKDENFDPVLNARCTNSLGSVFSQLCSIPTLAGFYGCCEFVGADVNTNYTTTIDPNRQNASAINTTFPTSDFYNSEGFSISPTCRNFDGNYQYLWNIDFDRLSFVDFAVQDCDSGRAVAGAVVSFEGRTCLTKINTNTQDNLNISLNWGTCRMRDFVFDYLPHEFNVSKRPYYEDTTETNKFLTQTPFFTCLERNTSRNDVNPEVAQTVQELGGANYDPIISAMFDPTFIVVIMSFMIGGVITFFSGSGFIGLSSISGFFMMWTWFGFLPIWIGLGIIMITGFLAVMTLRGVFAGG